MPPFHKAFKFLFQIKHLMVSQQSVGTLSVTTGNLSSREHSFCYQHFSRPIRPEHAIYNVKASVRREAILPDSVDLVQAQNCHVDLTHALAL
jgi:hypothetical protein